MKTATKKSASKAGAKATGAAAAGLGAGALPAPGATSDPADAQAAYDQHLPAAEALPASAVVAFHGNAELVYRNVQTAVNNVLSQKPALLAALKSPDFDAIASLPGIGLGLTFAASATKKVSARNDELQANLEQAKGSRALLLATCELLVQTGDLKAAALAAVRKGSGAIHDAEELGGLAKLLRANPTALAKTPVTLAQVNAAAALGATLLGQLRPKGAPKKGDAAAAAASDIRDRFYTLLVQARPQLWQLGAVAFGEDGVASKVPPLLSHGSHETLARVAAKAAKVATAAAAKATKAATRAGAVKPKPAKKAKKPR